MDVLHPRHIFPYFYREVQWPFVIRKKVIPGSQVTPFFTCSLRGMQSLQWLGVCLVVQFNEVIVVWPGGSIPSLRTKTGVACQAERSVVLLTHRWKCWGRGVFRADARECCDPQTGNHPEKVDGKTGAEVLGFRGSETWCLPSYICSDRSIPEYPRNILGLWRPH